MQDVWSLEDITCF